MLLPATPGWVSLPVVVCGSPPLLAGVCWRWWCVVCGVWCVVCGVRRWCVGGVVAGVWCGWSLATPGGGSCVLLPATPGLVSLVVVVGVPRHSWLRAPGAVPRHSWLGSAGGGGVWWGCGLCVVWLVPRHSWRRFLCATPRHSWLGFAARGGVRFPATPGWGLLAAVVRGVWCVVCGVWCAEVVCWWGCGWCVVWLVPRHSWRRFLCATPRHSWLGFAAGGGVWFPATPGWGLLAAVVCGVWCVVCGVWCVVCGGGVLVGLWLVCGVVGPWPLLAEVPVCYSPPLLARFRWRWWWAFLATPGGGSRARFPATPGWVSLAAVVCGVWCVVCGVWCVVCGAGVPGGAVAGVWCGWSLATPGEGSCVLLPATPGWVSLPVVVCGSPQSLAWGPPVVVVCFAGGGVLCCVCLWCVWVCVVAVLCCVLRVCGVCVCGGVVLWCGGCVFRVPFSLVLVCVCALCGPSCWCGWRGGGSCAVWLPCVCVCVLAVCGWWGVSYLGWFSSSVVGMVEKAEEEVGKKNEKINKKIKNK